MSHSALIIGYGNELRGDDGAGPRVAELAARRRWPGVYALAVRQLTPELAELVAQARLALFVDAGLPPDPATPTLRVLPVAPADQPGALGHTGTPEATLALARALYGACPPAWLIVVPAQSFALGAPLSPPARRGVVQALAAARKLCEGSPTGAVPPLPGSWG